MNVVVNGLMANYQKTGSGKKTLLMLHGWADPSPTFDKLVDCLKKDFTILRLDLPGFGGTQLPDRPWDLEDYAEFVNDWLIKINQSKVDSLIGHSFGGAVAITGLANGSLKADRLVLINSAGVRRKKTIRKSTLKAAAKTAKLPLYLLPAGRRTKIKKRLYASLGSDITLLPHMEATFRRIIGQDVQPAASTLKLPTLLIWGDRDNQTPIADGHRLNKAIANSRLEILPGGHFIHQERAQMVAGFIKEFMELA